MKATINSWCVLDCNNHIVAMDSGFECARLAKKMNGKGYRDHPYSVREIKGTIEC